MSKAAAQGELKIDVSPLRDAFAQLGASFGVMAGDMARAVNALSVSWSKFPAVPDRPAFEPNGRLEFGEALIVFEYVLDHTPVNDPNFYEALKSAEDRIRSEIQLQASYSPTHSEDESPTT